MSVCVCVSACVCILQNWVSDVVIHSIHYPVSDDISAEFSGNLLSGNVTYLRNIEPEK